MTKIVHILLFLSTLLLPVAVDSQGLSFTYPISIADQAQTDREPSITQYQEHYFIVWKTTGSSGNIMLLNLGKQYDTGSTAAVVGIPGAQSAFAPVIREFNNHLYLFWISPKGKIQYVLNFSLRGDPEKIEMIIELSYNRSKSRLGTGNTNNSGRTACIVLFTQIE